MDNTEKKLGSSSQATSQLDVLKKHFPNCFDKNGAFIPSKFQEIVDEADVPVSKEGYSLNWLGKSYARLLANEKIRTWLKADEAHNTKPENTESQNLLIKGDNLEVLKHLVGAYSEKVKMIYIDPPYNTGSDGFVYEDDRKFTINQLSNMAGVDEDEARRILEFTQSKANSHSAWLTFMYPRLYIARQLLKDEGVIFISIDDNEQAQLKLLCDEVFGEENFIAGFIVIRSEGGGLAKQAVIGHDYLLVYSKIKQTFKPLRKAKDIRGEIVEIDGEEYWIEEDWLRMEFGKYGTCPYSEIETYHGIDKKNEIDAGIEKGIYKLINKNGTEIVGRLRKISEDGSKLYTILKHLNKHGNENIESLGLKGIFDNPKPLSLLDTLVLGATFYSRQSDDIILDFFAGSGTTAHSVMQLNSEDSGNRKFITVQLPEITDSKSAAYKAGYKTIFDITKTRLERAASKIKEKLPKYSGDLGFKIYETVAMPEKYHDEPQELTENLELFDANKLDKIDRLNLMRTWATQDNIPLTQDLHPIQLAGYTAYQAKHLLYFIEPNITLDAVIKMLEQLDNNPEFKPSRLIVFGFLLDSKIQREMTEAIKHYNNRKGIELTLDIRY